jgi:ACS family glucarate transporter-like MFS transporter
MRHARWGLVALLSATATAGYLCRVNVSVAGALLMGEFGLSQIQMGRVFSAFLLGYALFQLPGGMLADRWGARRVVAVITWWWVLATLLQAAVGWGPLGGSAAGVLWTLVALRFILGVGAAPTYPASAQGVARWVPALARGRANGIVIGSVGLGSALAPPLVSSVMVSWGWRASLLVSALPALAMAVTWLFVGEPTAEAGPAGGAGRPGGAGGASGAGGAGGVPALPALLKSRSLGLLTLSYSLQGYVGYIFVFWFYLYLVQVRHFDLLRGAVLSSLPWILSIVSIPLGGVVSDRLVRGRVGPLWGRRLVAILGLAGSGALISLGARTGNAYLAAVYLALATALVLSVEGPFWATVVEIAGPRSGTAGGLMNTGCNIGGLISPALTPVLAASLGWENALHVAAALSIIGAALWLGIKPSRPSISARRGRRPAGVGPRTPGLP